MKDHKDLPETPEILDSSGTTSLGEPSLAQVLTQIEGDTNLPAQKRIAWRSALTRLSKYLGRDLSNLPARLGGLRYGVEGLHHAPLGISKKTLQNLKAELKAILMYAGELHSPYARGAPLTAEWQALENDIESPRHKRGLYRFVRFCSGNGILPCHVDDGVVLRFAEAISESTFTRKRSDAHRRTCRYLNEVADVTASWPRVMLQIPDSRQKPRSVAWEEFSEAFNTDVGRYLTWRWWHFA